MEGMVMKRPLVVNVKEYGSSVWTVIRLYSIDSIGSTAADPGVGLVLSANGLQYTTDKTPDELELMVAECCADFKEEETGEAAPKKSSAVALYLLVSGQAGIGEDGSVVDTRDFPDAPRLREDSLVKKVSMFRSISDWLPEPTFSGPISNVIHREVHNLAKQEFEKSKDLYDTGAPLVKDSPLMTTEKIYKVELSTPLELYTAKQVDEGYHQCFATNIFSKIISISKDNRNKGYVIIDENGDKYQTTMPLLDFLILIQETINKTAQEDNLDIQLPESAKPENTMEDYARSLTETARRTGRVIYDNGPKAPIVSDTAYLDPKQEETISGIPFKDLSDYASKKDQDALEEIGREFSSLPYVEKSRIVPPSPEQIYLEEEPKKK
ncbi:hypothetical protein [Dyadobacter sp. CY312]|uniref:hypothetical protein n=1 Tax=Dyadobacter sp. CY312 TaxID=2907303 RepID=UPI001F1B93CD|nr:hypothetical protein [Dyadobacter sp. CY312]MCE7039196.1 hypothetical protein [Dyadobacter sp. CY312]